MLKDEVYRNSPHIEDYLKKKKHPGCHVFNFSNRTVMCNQ